MKYTIYNLIILFIMPFLFAGIINRTKSFWSGREGRSAFQCLFDFIKLLRKGQVISSSSGLLYRTAPSFALGFTIAAGLAAPGLAGESIYPFEGDFILFGYLLSAGKFVSILGAMDSGSPFQGMGSSREASFSAFTEPALFLILSTLALISGLSDFSSILSFTVDSRPIMAIAAAVSSAVFFILLLAEGSRVPVDDPDTHLELTMIHEAMILDYSGPDLAFAHYTAWMKMTIFASIISCLVIPQQLSFIQGAALHTAAICLIAAAAGTVESAVARIRMSHVPQFLLIGSALSVILAAAVLVSTGGRL